MSDSMQGILINVLPRWVVAWLINLRDRIMHVAGRVTVPVRYSDFPMSKSVKYAYRSLLGNTPSILFFPEVPRHNSILYKLCVLCGYKISKKTDSKYEVLVWYENRTYSRYELGRNYIQIKDDNEEENIWYPNRKTKGGLLRVENLKKQKVLNGFCKDNSKKNVGEEFKNAFGYDINVDPRKYKGDIVVKPDVNGSHSGKIVEGPIPKNEIEEERVYQKKINNLTEDNEVVDMRVPMLGEKKPFVYIKKRPEEKRFSNENSKVHVADKESMFSEKEIKSIEKFRRLMGADLAEVDVLRDQGNGRIYIVDINNTPWGPPNGLSEAQKGRALRILSQAFMEMIESRVHP